MTADSCLPVWHQGEAGIVRSQSNCAKMREFGNDLAFSKLRHDCRRLSFDYSQCMIMPQMLDWPNRFSGFGAQERQRLNSKSTFMIAIAGAGLVSFGVAGSANEASGGRIWENKPSRLVYGNYCGFGTRHGSLAPKPINQLDEACQAHDACYIAGLNHCLCDAKLAKTAENIRLDPDTPRGERVAARTIEDLFSAKFCKLFPRGVFPKRNPEILKTWFPPAPPGDPDRPEKQ